MPHKHKQQAYNKLAVQNSEDDESDAGAVQQRKRPTAIPTTTTSTTSTHLDDEDDINGDDDDDEHFDGANGMFFQQRRRTGALFMVAVAVMTVLFLLIVYLVVRRNQIKNALETTTRSWRDAFPDEVVAMMDQDVDPCDDFYQFSCGKWVQESEIPPEKSSVYASFTAVQDRNEAVLRDIMAENWPFLGELYNSCMNMSAINATGIAPLQKGLQRLAGVKSKQELFTLAGELAKTGPDFLTGLAVSPDAKDATKYVLYASQSGLTLPDRDYYLDATKRNDTLGAFRTFITTMFEFTGHSQPDATRSDVLVVDFESELARIFVPKEELTDPTKIYNVMQMSDAMTKYPLLFAAYMNGTGILDMHSNVSSLATVVIVTPSFFEAAEELVAETDLTTLRTAMTFQYVQHFAPTLTEPFISAAFAFFKKKLSGQQERSPRWKVCLRQATAFFPSLVGKYYFLKQFDVKGEVRANELVQMLEAAMRKRLTKLQWLDATTRAAALKKLALVTNLIGHSTKQERFPFVLSPDALSTNIQILSQHQFERAVNKIGKTVDRDEWYMTAADVNAYYNPAGNQIVFPAGILQPPFFSSQFPAARNFGAIGSIIGHELTHGFDSQGRNYDGDGNMVGWWTNLTKQEFDRRAKCLVDQYDAFPVVSAFDANRVLGHVNGNFTLGENIADNGGVKLAFSAFQKLLAGEDSERGQAAGFIGGSRASSQTKTTSQLSTANAQKLFFVAFAQAFCAKSSDEAMVRRLSTDPHSPERWRVNGVMRNSDDFSRTFECPRGASMNPEAKCKLW